MDAILLVALLGSIYFFPTLMAFLNRHHNTAAIFILNLFFGWTLLGWVAALIWAYVKPAPARPA
jgi:ABC-type transport system involved in cytochrome c biogenesis permease component